MVVYLACTVRGDRAAVTGLRSLTESLERNGHTILTKHLLDDGVDQAESAMTNAGVYARDVEWLESCDVLIAEASGSTFGVGFEVGYVLGRSDRTSQRVVLIHRADCRDRISRLISGNTHPRCTVLTYENPAELIDRVLSSLQAGP